VGQNAKPSACMPSTPSSSVSGEVFAAGELLSAHGLARLLCCTVVAGFNEDLHASSMHVFVKSYWSYQSTG
jgi:hypothetical protein